MKKGKDEPHPRPLSILERGDCYAEVVIKADVCEEERRTGKIPSLH
jgi:hypothetical protein